MTIAEIQRKLNLARATQRSLRKQIDQYRGLLINSGLNPDKPKVDLLPRNKRIYKLWKRGKSFTQIATETNLSPTRLASICHRIDYIIKQKAPIPDEYMDIAYFKKGEQEISKRSQSK